MLDQHQYVNEKLREFESRRVVRTQFVEHSRGKPVLAPLARPVGRALHRLGHRLESWAAPSVEQERREPALRGRMG